MHTLIGKVNRDQTFGANSEFKAAMYPDANKNLNDSSRSDSLLSNSSSTASDVSNGDKTIVDLDLVVEKWIGWMWEKTKTKAQATKYEFEDLEILVDWSKSDIAQDDAKFEGPRGVHAASVTPSHQTLFRTYFTNSTDQEQSYSFKTERVTRQSCAFTFLKGFSREKEGAVNIKIPGDILELGGGMRSEQTVECGKDQTKEEEVSWGVDSSINVQPNCKTRADLVINELQLERNFLIETRISGRIVVTMNHRKENNAFVKSLSGDLVEIFRNALDKGWLPRGSQSLFDIQADSNGNKFVKSVLKGVCRFRMGVEQHVTLSESRLPSPSKATAPPTPAHR